MKFYSTDGNHIVAAWVATGLLIPIIFVFIAFAAHFYLKVHNFNLFWILMIYVSLPKLVGHKSEVYEHNLKELELLKDQLDIEDQDVQSGVGNHIIWRTGWILEVQEFIVVITEYIAELQFQR